MSHENGNYTYRIQVTNRERVQAQKYDSHHRDKGQPSGRLLLDNLARLQDLSRKASREGLTAVEVQELGEGLFDVLFDDGLRPDFVTFYTTAVHENKAALRIELDIDEHKLADLAALPWEMMRVPVKANLGVLWLGSAPDVVLSRRRAQWIPAPVVQLEPGEKLRIAMVVSAPEGLGPVEYERLLKALQKLVQQNPDRIELLDLVTEATQESIDDILRQEPHIFHFIGHAEMDETHHGRVALTDDVLGDALWISADSFSDLFNRHRPDVVLLQACEGGQLSAGEAFAGIASRIVQQNIPVVVAMQHEVTNATAVRFAARFYQQLAQFAPVDLAVQEGRRSVAFAVDYKKRDFASPVIFMRVADGRLFAPVEEVVGENGRGATPTPVTRSEPKPLKKAGRVKLSGAVPQELVIGQPAEVAVRLGRLNSTLLSPEILTNLPPIQEIDADAKQATLTVKIMPDDCLVNGPDTLPISVGAGLDSDVFFFSLTLQTTSDSGKTRVTLVISNDGWELGSLTLYAFAEHTSTRETGWVIENEIMPTKHARKRFLRELVAQHFPTQEEIDILAINVGLGRGYGSGSTPAARAVSLVQQCDQRGLLDKLVIEAHGLFPQTDWVLLADLSA